MKNQLFIVEGLPCSGKSSTSAFAASLLEGRGDVRFVDEGTGDHPADYEFHALAPAGLVSDRAEIVPLSRFTGRLLEQLLPYKIYDGLPWEAERPVMLDKWRQFVRACPGSAVYVFNCVLLQNPMCETMMRFGFPEETSMRYIREIAQIIRPLHPVVIYLKNTEIAASVHRAAQDRPGWLDAVIPYHVNGGYGRQTGAAGFEGYIRCLEERQARELRILSALPVQTLILDNPQRDWACAHETIRQFLSAL
ncbi:MAG: hypothetical protein J6K32_07695 [Clostridia bacterium]|nr:hypothetical protein [Clostridia bacterium]